MRKANQVMSGFVRPKRVTDPLDDIAKARLVGGHFSYASSGSEHSADHSPCLSELVHGFLLEEKDHETKSSLGYGPDSDPVVSVADSSELIEDVLESTGISNSDAYRNLLLAHVLKGMELFTSFKSDKPVFRRKVMSFMRDLGHNAAICKTKWESSGGLTAGCYEFIDAVRSDSSTLPTHRYVIDLEFSSQFEIARPTSQYLKLSQTLPRVFVGKSDDLKRIVKVMCDAARRSLKIRDLSLPPWRKNRYMQNKWFGPYRRTVNPAPATSSPASAVAIPSVNCVKCRYVGFDDCVDGRLFVRTR